jgi:ETFB lysine methyltransferase
LPAIRRSRPKASRDGLERSGVSEPVENMGAITWHDGVPGFRGLPLELRTVHVAGMDLQIVAMVDATQLLDQADCAKRFLDADVAPYGVELWPAAIMLAEYIGRLDFKPRRALEIGCGLGFVSIFAARLGWSIVAGDHEPSALVFARHNAKLNGDPDIRFIEFDWRKPPSDLTYDCVLGADILYQLNNHGPILACLDRLLEDDGIAFISDPNRGVADHFAAAACAARFTVEITPAAAEGPSGRLVEGRIFRIYRPGQAITESCPPPSIKEELGGS